MYPFYTHDWNESSDEIRLYHIYYYIKNSIEYIKISSNNLSKDVNVKSF